MRYIVAIIAAVFICMAQANAQTNALQIQPNGNVGVGTDNPTEKLEVNGNLKVNGRISDQTGPVMPVGTVLPFAGSVAPAGWLLCDGKSYARTGQQKDLFAVIGTLYGSEGDKFRVPDLRQTFVMGAAAGTNNDSLAKRGEADVHNHLVKADSIKTNVSEAGDHQHRYTDKWYKRVYEEPWIAGKGRYSGLDTHGDDVASDKVLTQMAGKHTHNVTVQQPFHTENSTGNNRPKWISLNYIIKY